MKRHFTSEEVREYVFENEVKTIPGEDRRWSRTNITIIELDGKYYSLEWEQGLTENQENDFYEQDAPEVKKVEKEITKTIVTWDPID